MLDLFPLLAAGVICLAVPVYTLAGVIVGYRRVRL